MVNTGRKRQEEIESESITLEGMKEENDSLEDGGDDERREGGVRRLVGRRRLQRLGWVGGNDRRKGEK